MATERKEAGPSNQRRNRLVQRFHPTGLPNEVVGVYEEECLLGLQMLSPDGYRAVVWRLSPTIAELYTPSP